MLLPFKNLPRFLILLKINYELFPISWKAPYNQTPAYLSALIYYHCPLYSVPQRHTSVCTTLNMPRLTTGPLHLLCHWPVWFCLRFSTGFLTPIHRFSKSFPPQREKKMATHSSILSWRIHGWRSLVGYRPRGRKESDMTSLSLLKTEQLASPRPLIFINILYQSNICKRAWYQCIMIWL